ncbi:MAG: NAD(+)/NADH kinase [Nitrospira sp.]|nr:NAD(+)/NADH kinase [bacterium]MBL7031730.1 NAD(+)/NADH kinase [Nitrospira sp.]
MKRIGIIAKKNEPETLKAVEKFITGLRQRDCEIFLEEEIASSLSLKGTELHKIPETSDVIVVFGGDGTLLSVARLVGNQGVPILGINLGGLGFITELNRDEVDANLEMLFSESYCYEERIMLLANVYRNGEKMIEQNALNDVVLNKSALSRMFYLDLHISGHYATSLRADGLIVSTPTGSTAHSLSAGGPILYPTLESFLITPICPHTLTSRPIVLPDSVSLDVIITSGTDVYLTIDGQVGFPLQEKDKIVIHKAEYKTKFIVLQDRDYFRILRKKLKWGE